ncbi:MAG TPA: hypothetical protein VHT68_08510 [Pseudolabrys sp.]|nr:hypothetical protein [Pseudolabrys sp.]
MGQAARWVIDCGGRDKPGHDNQTHCAVANLNCVTGIVDHGCPAQIELTQHLGTIGSQFLKLLLLPDQLCVQLPHIPNGRSTFQENHLSPVFSNKLPDQTHVNCPLIFLDPRIWVDEQLVERPRVPLGCLSSLENFRTNLLRAFPDWLYEGNEERFYDSPNDSDDRVVIHGLTSMESAKDRADLKHSSLSLAFIFLIVILFCSKADLLHPSFG